MKLITIALSLLRDAFSFSFSAFSLSRIFEFELGPKHEKMRTLNTFAVTRLLTRSDLGWARFYSLKEKVFDVLSTSRTRDDDNTETAESRGNAKTRLM